MALEVDTVAVKYGGEVSSEEAGLGDLALLDHHTLLPLPVS